MLGRVGFSLLHFEPSLSDVGDRSLSFAPCLLLPPLLKLDRLELSLELLLLEVFELLHARAAAAA